MIICIPGRSISGLRCVKNITAALCTSLGMLFAYLSYKFWMNSKIDRLTRAMTTQGSVPNRDLSAEKEQQPSLTASSCSSNVTSFSVPLSFSGPAVRYNAEFTKRIPVTGLGGFPDPIISVHYGLLSMRLQQETLFPK